jgi:outer membrane protein assembly factor BamB
MPTDARRHGTHLRPEDVRAIAREHAPRALRYAAIAVVCVGLIAGVGGLIRLVQGTEFERLSADNVERLAPLWSAEAGAGPLGTPSIEDGGLYVSSADGVAAYPVPCPVEHDACEPLFRARTPDGPMSAPVRAGDAVYAGSADGRLYAFPAHCPKSGCEPLWVGLAGRGPVTTPGVNDDFAYAASDDLYAFPAACGSEDRNCPPAWRGVVPGGAGPGAPGVGAGVIVVASDSEVGGVYGFPAVCSDPCEPLWSGETDGPVAGVAVSGDTAYAIARGQVMAFPLSCTGPCSPSWSGPFLAGGPFAPGAISPPSVDGGQVLVGDAGGRLWVFPDGCGAALCPPLRSVALDDSPLETPVAGDGVIYVASTDGRLFAVRRDCDPAACAAAWSTFLGAASEGAPAVAGDAVYVGDVEGRLHAYSVGGR